MKNIFTLILINAVTQNAKIKGLIDNFTFQKRENKIMGDGWVHLIDLQEIWSHANKYVYSIVRNCQGLLLGCVLIMQFTHTLLETRHLSIKGVQNWSKNDEASTKKHTRVNNCSVVPFSQHDRGNCECLRGLGECLDHLPKVRWLSTSVWLCL